MMPYNHFGSYLAGIIVGYILVKHKDKEIPKVVQTLFWILSAVVATLVILGPHEAYKSNEFSILESSLYYALARPAWSWAIAWIVFACGTGRGGPIAAFLSWPAFSPLSSLSYLAYLTHPILMLIHTGRIRERIYFGHYEMMTIFLSRLILTFFLAYFVHVMIEVPFASIETYIFPKKKMSIKKSSNFQRQHHNNGPEGAEGAAGSSSPSSSTSSSDDRQKEEKRTTTTIHIRSESNLPVHHFDNNNLHHMPDHHHHHHHLHEHKPSETSLKRNPLRSLTPKFTKTDQSA